jgi:hypothetical protein
MLDYQYGICIDCLTEGDGPVFFKVLKQNQYHYVNKCPCHYILDVEEPPMFLPMNKSIAYYIFCYYQKLGSIKDKYKNFLIQKINSYN